MSTEWTTEEWRDENVAAPLGDQLKAAQQWLGHPKE